MTMERLIEQREAERRREAELRLQEAIEKGNPRLISLMLDQGCDPNALMSDPNNGMTMLHLAARCGDAGAVLMLLEKGASIDRLTRLKMTPMMFAARHEKPLAAQLLIERGAKVGMEDWKGNTALHFAAEHGRAEVCAALLAAGAKVDAMRSQRNSDSSRPLHLAAAGGGNAQTCRVLLEAGAKWDSFDLHNKTPLHIAAANGYLAVCRVLVEYGADPDFVRHPILQRSSSSSPCQEAIMNGHADVAKFFLLDCGADRHQKSRYGESLEELARYSDNQEILRTLHALGVTNNVEGAISAVAAKNGGPDRVKSKGLSPL